MLVGDVGDVVADDMERTPVGLELEPELRNSEAVAVFVLILIRLTGVDREDEGADVGTEERAEDENDGVGEAAAELDVE